MVGLGATTAAADPFVTMDRQSDQSVGGAEGSYLFPRTDSSGSLTLLRFDAHGQWVDPGSGFGGYGAMMITHYSASSGGTSMSATGFGDLEAGGIYSPKLDSPTMKVFIHAGLTLPSGSTGQNELISNIIGVLTRLDDFYQIIPKGTSLRLGVSPQFHQDELFARIDVGLDSNISQEQSSSVSTVFKVNAGVGLDLGAAIVMAEVINLHADGQSSSTGASWINTGAVSARLRAGTVAPYGAFVFPLDHDSHQFMSAALTIGVDAAIR